VKIKRVLRYRVFFVRAKFMIVRFDDCEDIPELRYPL